MGLFFCFYLKSTAVNYKHINSREIEAMDRIYRLNLINSISGYKSANLIGTEEKGYSNLAIFSSVTHLGSNPPLLGMVSRPNTVDRHTLDNLRSSGQYTINHIFEGITEQAHYTSAKFDKVESEFEHCNMEKEYFEGFSAPFVKQSPVKLGMKLVEEIPIKSNGTLLIVGEIEIASVAEELLTANGQLDLNRGEVVAISGLNRYHQVREIAQYPYARKEELPAFKK